MSKTVLTYKAHAGYVNPVVVDPEGSTPEHLGTGEGNTLLFSIDTDNVQVQENDAVFEQKVWDLDNSSDFDAMKEFIKTLDGSSHLRTEIRKIEEKFSTKYNQFAMMKSLLNGGDDLRAAIDAIEDEKSAFLVGVGLKSNIL